MMINLYIIYYIWNKKQVIELTINKIWKWWRSIEQENKGMVSNMKNRRKKNCRNQRIYPWTFFVLEEKATNQILWM